MSRVLCTEVCIERIGYVLTGSSSPHDSVINLFLSLIAASTALSIISILTFLTLGQTVCFTCYEQVVGGEILLPVTCVVQDILHIQ